MAEWAKVVGARKSKEFGNIEITEKLPDGWSTIVEKPTDKLALA